jgi:hypothetical protein
LRHWRFPFKTDCSMIFLHGLLLAGIVYYVFKNSRVEDKFLFWSAWLFRVMMGIAVGLIYTYYYNANDTWHFFEDAKTLSALARTNFSEYIKFLFAGNSEDSIWQTLFYTQERSLFLVKLISVLAFLGNDNYWTCVLYFSTISFLAVWTLFATITKHFEKTKLAAALAFLFLPSVVFWSSGLVKETLALAGIFWMSAVFLKFLKKDKISWIQILIGFLLLIAAWSLKYYWTALFLIVLSTTWIIYIAQRFAALKSFWWLAWGMVFIIICTLASQAHPNFYFSRFLEVIVTNHEAFVQISKPDGIIHFDNLRANWWSMIINSPVALASGLFRPWIGEAKGLTGFIAALENLFMLILLIGTLFRTSWKIESKLLVTSLIVYIVLLCILLALSTPNFGTLSRYRVGFLPFFVFLIANRNPIIEFFQRRVPFLNR